MRLRISMTVLSGLVLAGCSPVFVNEPIGKQVELDMEHIEKIEGRWQAGDSYFEVEHVDGSRFRVTKIESDPKRKQSVENRSCDGQTRPVGNFRREAREDGGLASIALPAGGCRQWSTFEQRRPRQSPLGRG